MSVFFEQDETISISDYLCHYPEKKKTSNLSYETIYFIETINKKKVFTTFSGEIKIDTF